MIDWKLPVRTKITRCPVHIKERGVIGFRRVAAYFGGNWGYDELWYDKDGIHDPDEDDPHLVLENYNPCEDA